MKPSRLPILASQAQDIYDRGLFTGMAIGFVLGAGLVAIFLT